MTWGVDLTRLRNVLGDRRRSELANATAAYYWARGGWFCLGGA